MAQHTFLVRSGTAELLQRPLRSLAGSLADNLKGS